MSEQDKFDSWAVVELREKIRTACAPITNRDLRMVEQAYPLIVAHVARRAINCAPSRSDNIGVSDRNIGFRDGWNAARDLMLDRIEREFKKEKP